jgi:hypothetical protein
MLENLLQATRNNYGTGSCKTAKVITRLDTADADILTKVLSDVDGYSTYGIFRGLRESGVDIGYASLDRHRKNLCSCTRPNA